MDSTHRLPQGLSVFEFFLLSLAAFRLTRLFVYDKITQFIRDWFLRKEVLAGEDGELVIVRRKYVQGPLRTASELLECPWCFGVWAAACVLFFYFITPLSVPVILLLAIAGVATFFQLLATMVGWRAERLKQKVEGK
ncbi:sporulation protein [Candidatus Kaiserbacteria bacterium CG10_big_fil_rev_8_21_14_0_10_49_17]|uniref:Sporulation protein n=1 Tax=Candidatus Kaiserbacteria bacterium CG10_big_fil_rev_8_21_14_0_10_49_17 TaxID=1974609 RepID=A0A2M6WDU1_9BACT|nr:MAG: sporulation protein [Candidatus Kaiserbacteria bacterium CG10_big_fil_rev_8_21_14_0_10_49_17]